MFMGFSHMLKMDFSTSRHTENLSLGHGI